MGFPKSRSLADGFGERRFQKAPTIEKEREESEESVETKESEESESTIEIKYIKQREDI